MQAPSRALADSTADLHQYLLQVAQAKLDQTRPSSMPARCPLQALICSMIDAAFLAEQGKGLIPILATGGTQRLPINDIEHSKTKANYPATNGILEAFV